MRTFAREGLKLNLGSGQRKFSEPWINVDCQKKWEPDIVADASKLTMLKDRSADTIVLHHVLEHYGCGEARALLQECYRLLACRGSLLIFVPDMFKICEAWMTGRINYQIFATNIYGAYMGDEADRHKWGYEFLHLKDELTKVGFDDPIRFDWRVVKGADIARDWWILGVEAVK